MMLIYAMSIPSWFDQGIYKIGEALNEDQLGNRKRTMQTYHVETVDVYAFWDIGDITKKADNRLHTIFEEYRFGHGGLEIFKGIALSELDEKVRYIFGPNVIRRK